MESNSWSVDTNDQETQRETGTIANRRENNLESALSENQNSPEQWGSTSANCIRLSWYKGQRVSSRPHRLMKTCSKQSKRRGIHISSNYIVRQMIKQFTITYNHDEQ